MSIAATISARASVYSHAMDDAGRVLSRAEELAQEFLAGLGTRPVWPRATFEEMLAAFDEPLPESGADPVAVVEELARTADAGLVGTAGPRFFGFVIGGSIPAAIGADVLTSTWDQNAGLNSLTPAAAAVEVVAGRWVVEALGLPVGSAVGLVTGGMMANYACLSAARHACWPGGLGRLRARAVRGAAGARRRGRGTATTPSTAPCATSASARTSVVEVDTDDEGRISVDALESALGRAGPVIVCLQAGEVHTGAFDDFARAIPLARRYDAWVHVDGAFGLWAAASPRTGTSSPAWPTPTPGRPTRTRRSTCPTTAAWRSCATRPR